MSRRTPPASRAAPAVVERDATTGPGLTAAAEAAFRLHARVLESMHEGVSVSDEAGVIVYTNPAEDRMFGYAPGELVGRHVTVQNAYAPEENARRVAEVIAELRARGEWEGEWENVRKDGTPFVTRARITALELDGRPHWVCVQEDVTARVAALAAAERARAEAEAARAVASALVESVRDAFVAYDRDFRFTYVNAAAGELFAATRDAGPPIGQVLWEAYPQLVGTPVEAAMRRAMAERVPTHFDSHDPVLRRWYAARVYPAADGGLSAVWADVTAERRARDAATFLADASRLLAASLDYEATLRAVAESAVPGLGDWCAVDVVEDPAAGAWPPRVARLAVVHRDPAMLALGEELNRRYPTDWSAEGGMAGVLRDGTPLFIPEVTEAMVVAGARDAEHLALLRALRFSSILVVPLVARGLTLGALTLCMTESGRRYDEGDRMLALDVAQRAALAVDNARLYRDAERARAQAEQARAEAEAASRAKGEFLAVMSHELRTPLNAIGGYAELMEMGLRGPVTPEQREDLARIQTSQRHLLGLVNGVLNYARAEAGAVPYDVADVPLDEVLAACEALVAPQARAKGVALATVGGAPVRGGGGLVARADREKTRQVVLNLLSNAVKFTAPGGAITLSAEGAAGSRVAVRVRDTGRGIAADQLARIFEPFVQVDQGLTRPHEGVGLGLAISRDLARGMGGDLTAESTPGVGSTFTLTLPAA